MLNLIKPGTTTNVLAIAPITASALHTNVSGSFTLNITQDYDLTSASLDLSKLDPVPQNSLGRYLLFGATSSEIPSASGMYTYGLEEKLLAPAAIWGTTIQAFGLADYTWDSENVITLRKTIDTGRVKVEGDDAVTSTQYGGGPSVYGAYKTYSN